jgi:hypothetical protein
MKNLRWLFLPLLATLLSLQGCGTNTGTANIITGVSLENASQDSHLSQRPNEFCDSADPAMQAQCTPELLQSLKFAEIDKNMLVWLEGMGTCVASVDFGDGTPLWTTESVHTWPWPILHTYTGWPGKKLIRVKAESGCLGDLTKEITVGIGPEGREVYHLGFRPNTNVCNAVPGMPPLRKGSGVRIGTDGNVLDYGLPQFNASGDLSGATPSDYPFPMFRAFSLVYKMGNSPPIQGEAGEVVFTAPETAPLEVCVNDFASYLTDNSGLMRIDITVNEISAE